MGRPNEPTRHWNNTSRCIVTINRITGRIYFPLQNLLTIMPLARPPGSPPFFTNKGYHPNISVHPERELASRKACEFAINLDELHTALKEQIKTAQSCYQASTDAHCAPAPSFPTSSYAFVKAQFFCTTWPSKKLTEKYLGQFEVITQVGRDTLIYATTT